MRFNLDSICFSSFLSLSLIVARCKIRSITQRIDESNSFDIWTMRTTRFYKKCTPNDVKTLLLWINTKSISRHEETICVSAKRWNSCLLCFFSFALFFCCCGCSPFSFTMFLRCNLWCLICSPALLLFGLTSKIIKTKRNFVFGKLVGNAKKSNANTTTTKIKSELVTMTALIWRFY